MAKKRKRSNGGKHQGATAALTNQEAIGPRSGSASGRATCSRDFASNTFDLPTELPLADQQVLLRHLQEILEDMCLRVGLAVCPAMMERKGWTQAKSLELHRWIHFLRNVPAQLTDFPIRVSTEDHNEMLRDVANIRHSAVHRNSRSIQSICTSLEAAHAFAELHQDAIAKEAIARSMRMVDEISRDISSQQELLQKDLRRQINELQDSTSRQNKRVLVQAGKKIMQLLRPPFDEPDAVSGSHLDGLMHSEDYCDPPDIKEVEVALLEAEQAPLVGVPL